MQLARKQKTQKTLFPPCLYALSPNLNTRAYTTPIVADAYDSVNALICPHVLPLKESPEAKVACFLAYLVDAPFPRAQRIALTA